MSEKVDTLADLVVVHALRDGGDDGGLDARLLEVRERSLTRRALIAGAAQDAERRVAEGVELKRDVDAALGDLFAERIVGRAAQAVRGDGNARDFRLRARHVEKLEELRMHRRLAAGEVDRLDLPLFLDETVEDAAELLLRHVVIVPILHDANRALEIAVIRDLDDRQTRMLLVIGAEPAIVRAAFFHLRRVDERNRAFLDVGQRLEKPIRVAADERLALTVSRALLPQIHLPVANQANAIDGFLAGRTEAFRERVEGLLVSRGLEDGELGIDDRKLHHGYTKGRERLPVAGVTGTTGSSKAGPRSALMRSIISGSANRISRSR